MLRFSYRLQSICTCWSPQLTPQNARSKYWCSPPAALPTKRSPSGLESAREHAQVFSGLNDQEAEAILLLTFIPQKSGGSESALTTTWRQGDADRLTRLTKEGYADYPAFAERLLDARNRNWIPKIERDLQSGKISFVVVGAAHLGGPTGVVALLRQCGYQVEQL